MSDISTFEHEDQSPQQAPSYQASSPLDRIAAELESLSEEKTWEIPARPGWELVFNTAITSEEFKRYQQLASGGPANRKSRRAQRGASPTDVDQFLLFTALIREKSTQIKVQGEVLRTLDGDDMTLGSKEFYDFIKKSKGSDTVNDQNEAVEFLLGAGYLLKLGESIAAEAGFEGEANPKDDPLNG